MKRRFLSIGVLVFLMLGLTQFNVGAQDRQFTVTVVPLNGQPFIVEDFNQGGYRHYEALWRGSNVKLLFSDIVSISFLKPGDVNYPVEVSFKDGRKDSFALRPASTMKGKSTFGNWEMSHGQVKQISFGGGASAFHQSVGEPMDHDQVVMKNGDVLSGRVLTSEFILRTSYGTHNFQANQVQTINLEGGGQNIDVLLLRIGDRLSGVIENTAVKIQMRSGTQVELSKDKIKDIVFKK